MKKLTSARFTVPTTYAALKAEPYALHFQEAPQIGFVGGADHQLSLTFDEGQQDRELYLPTLKLAIRY